MNFINTYFPITVLSAILLFIIKELIEFFRKKSQNKRKLDAIKKLISNQLEVNNWALERLYYAINCVKEDLETFENPIISINYTKDNIERITFKRQNDEAVHLSFPIPKIEIIQIEKYLLDIAELDQILFTKSQILLDSLKELNHIRSNFLEALENEDSFVTLDDLKEAFYDYAILQKDEIYKALNDLYFCCIGENLEKKKIR